MSRMINWHHYGIELAGTASDGLSALEMFRELRPDLVMTDIRMPGLDGLQLIEMIMAESPETACLVFSGFNEFDYIRKALKLGVVDYIEKPITIEKIDEAMRRVSSRIGKQREHTEMKTKLHANREALLEKATLDLLLLGEEACQEWRSLFEEGDSRVSGVTVLAASERQDPLDEDPSYKAITFANGEDWVTAVFHYTLPADSLWEQLMLRSMHMQGSLGSGRTYENLAEAGKSYKEALHALRYARFLEDKGWTRFEHAEESESFPDGLSEREEELVFYLRTGNREGLLQHLNVFQEWMESERIDPDTAEREVLKLAYLGYQVAKESGWNVRQIGKHGGVSHQELGRMRSRDEMLDWLREQMEGLLTLAADARKSSRHSSVDKALLYIANHYTRDLTLQEVAEHVGMNTTYFSLLFKEKAGLSYIKHVTKLRLEQAKLLLRNGMRVNEASERVGYYNYRHFTELFKKHVGVTPGQYRESREGLTQQDRGESHE